MANIIRELCLNENLNHHEPCGRWNAYICHSIIRSCLILLLALLGMIECCILGPRLLSVSAYDIVLPLSSHRFMTLIRFFTSVILLKHICISWPLLFPEFWGYGMSPTLCILESALLSHCLTACHHTRD